MLDSIDPVRDLEIINEELMLKDIAAVTAEVVALEKVVGREKHRKPELVCLTRPLCSGINACLGNVQKS